MSRRPGRLSLAALIGLCALPLLYFKFRPLVAGQFGGFSVPDTALTIGSFVPIALSFYTLQAISYLVDIHRRTGPSSPNARTHALFLAFFPQLLAGPIERAGKLVPQLRYLSRPSPVDLYVGAKTILWGYFCKLVIADNIGGIVDRLLATHSALPASSLPAALYLYSFQIYFDFYGYSLVAIGLARAFGIHLTPNFNQPYLAASLRDFWRRWHITLSSWLRDYVYRPLGGRTKGARRFVFALTVTFFISSLWHGVSINFLMWGAFHASIFGFADFTQPLRSRLKGILPRDASIHKVGRGLSVWVCFSIVSFAWLFFRIHDVDEIWTILMRLVRWASEGVPIQLAPLFYEPETFSFLALLACALLFDASGLAATVTSTIPRRPYEIARELAVVNLAAITLLFFGDLGTREFIYFGF